MADASELGHQMGNGSAMGRRTMQLNVCSEFKTRQYAVSCSVQCIYC